MKRLNITTDDPTHRELKSEAAKVDYTIIEAANEAIKDWIRKMKSLRN